MSHPDSGRGDTDDMAAQIYRANLAARAERAAEIREALPGAAYWATLAITIVATTIAWSGLAVDLGHDTDDRIGYGGAVTLAVAALCALATMITGAVGAHDYAANRRSRRLAELLDRQHREVLARLEAFQPAGHIFGVPAEPSDETEEQRQRAWFEYSEILRGNAANGGVVPLDRNTLPRSRNGRS